MFFGHIHPLFIPLFPSKCPTTSPYPKFYLLLLLLFFLFISSSSHISAVPKVMPVGPYTTPYYPRDQTLEQNWLSLSQKPLVVSSFLVKGEELFIELLHEGQNLLEDHEDLNSDPQYPCKVSADLLSTDYSRTQSRNELLQALVSLAQKANSRFCRRACFKEQRGRMIEQDTQCP